MSHDIKPSDLSNITSVGNVSLSPDQNRIAFDACQASIEENNYENRIYLYDLRDGDIEIVSNDGYGPKWTQDGKKLVYLTCGKNDSTHLVLANLSGGSKTRLTKVQGTVESFELGPDGRLLLLEKPENQQRIHRITTLPFWYDGEGFIYDVTPKVSLINLLTGNKELILDPHREIYSATLSPNGEMIACVVNNEEKNPRLTDVEVMKIDDSSVNTIASNLIFDQSSMPAWGPDGESVAVQGHRFEKGYASHNDIWLFSLNGASQKLTDGLEKNVGGHLYSDILSPFDRKMPQSLIWDNTHIYFRLADNGKINLARINPSSNEIDVLENEKSGVNSFSVNRGIVVFSQSTQREPTELWKLDARNGQTDKLTNLNQGPSLKTEATDFRTFEHEVSDGESVTGWVTKPFPGERREEFPVVLSIHGGPKSIFGYGYMFEHQLLASNGYGVIYMNPRGSEGYTEEFADIRGSWGERDYEDIMEILQKLLKNNSWINPDQLGVMGGSYGGFMTNWIITQTNKFSAAISEESVSDQISNFADTDIGFHFDRDAMGGSPWDNLEEYLEKSSFLKAPQVQTPTLFIHAMDDYRCGVDQSIEFFTALKYLDKHAELVLFPEGGHSFKWTGKPKDRVKRLEIKLEWLKRHLKD